MRRFLSVSVSAFALAAAGMLVPGAAFAVDGVQYVERSWNGSAVVSTNKTMDNCTKITVGDNEWTTGCYVVDGNVTTRWSVTVGGDVKLVLNDGATLTSDCGIRLLPGKKLTVYGQTNGTGRLTSTPCVSTGRAGIGGRSTQSAGALVVHGGTVTATGDDSTAGIGGGDGGNGGSVTVYGGTVIATGGIYAAGIGGGNNGGNGGSVTVYGGTVIATGKKGSAGIGGGNHGGAGASVTVYGGTVNATGGNGGAGIGGGRGGAGGSVRITGGYVVAEGQGPNWFGAGIGGGSTNDTGTPGDGANVTVSGGTVIAKSGAAYGIGSGINGNGDIGNPGSFTASGNALVMASGPKGGIHANSGRASWTGVIAEGVEGSVTSAAGVAPVVTSPINGSNGSYTWNGGGSIGNGQSITVGGSGVTLDFPTAVNNQGTITKQNGGQVTGDVQGNPVTTPTPTPTPTPTTPTPAPGGGSGSGGVPSVPVGPSVSGRLAGNDRVATSLEVFKEFPAATTAVLATGNNYPDGLTATTLAAALKTGTLLTVAAPGQPLEADVLATLKAQGIKSVSIVGGTGVVPSSVEASLTAAGIEVTRYAGANRYKTAAKVAAATAATRGKEPSKYYVVSGRDFPDALAAGPVAALNNGVLVLAENIDKSLASKMTKDNTVCVGGPACNAYPNAGAKLIGKDRYATAKELLSGYPAGNHARAVVASGKNFPDALSAGPLAASKNQYLLLSNGKSVSAPATVQALTLIGGKSALNLK